MGVKWVSLLNLKPSALVERSKWIAKVGMRRIGLNKKRCGSVFLLLRQYAFRTLLFAFYYLSMRASLFSSLPSSVSTTTRPATLFEVDVANSIGKDLIEGPFCSISLT